MRTYVLSLRFADMWLHGRAGWLCVGGLQSHYTPAEIRFEQTGPDEEARAVARCEGLIREMEQRNYMLRMAKLVAKNARGYPDKQVWEYDAPLAPKPIPVGEMKNWTEHTPVPFDTPPTECSSYIGRPEE